MSATMAPRIEIYTRLVCDAYRPEYTVGRGKDRLPNPDVVFSPSVILDGKYKLLLSMTFSDRVNLLRQDL